MTDLIMGPDPRPDLAAQFPGIHIWGWMSSSELLWLRETASVMNSVVEIGSLHGRSAYALLTGCEGPVVCIDPWDDEYDQSYTSFIRSCGHFDNLQAWSGTSIEAAARWKREARAQTDMTFIDGAHTYESVMADIALWLPLTAKCICGHDYIEGEPKGFPGVHKAVTEVFGDRVRVAKHEAGPTSIWYVILSDDRKVEPGLPTHFDWTDEYGKHYVEDVTW